MRASLVVVLALVVLSSLASAETLRVPSEFSTIGAALKKAKRGDVVLIAPGSYEEVLYPPSGVTIRGSGPLSTVIHHASLNVIEVHGVDVVVESLRVEGKHQDDAKQTLVFVLDGGSLHLRDCIVTGSPSAGVETGGSDAKVEIDGCELTRNRATGLYIHDGAEGSVRGSSLSGNRSGVQVTGAGSQLRIVDSTLSSNDQTGIFVTGGAVASAARSLMANNGLHGAQVEDSGSLLNARHLVVSANRQDGIWVFGQGSVEVLDSIIADNGFWGLTTLGNEGEDPAASLVARNNLYWNNGRGNYEEASPHKSEIVDRDPGFRDPANGDFRLSPSSPAIGKGSGGDNLGLYPKFAPPSKLVWRFPSDATKGGGAGSVPVVSPPPRQVRKRAIVIGIQNYRDSKIRTLKFTRNDADDMATVLRSAGYEVTLLTDKSDPPASEDNIEEALLEIANAGPDEHFVFYFSDHGSDATNTFGEGRGFLLPVDTNSQRIQTTAVPLEKVRKAVDRSEAERVVVLLDSCFAAGGKSVSRRKDSRGSIGEREITGGLTFGKGKFALYSSRDNEPSLESDSHENGYFTHYLIEAWNKGHRDVDDVYSYLYDRVKDDTGDTQHPRRRYEEIEGKVSLF